MDARHNDAVPDRFWGGFAAGALIGTAASVAAVIISHAIGSSRDRRIVRLEDSIQVGRPLPEVFRAWSDFQEFPRYLRMLRNVRIAGSRSDWEAEINGKEFRWTAETTQLIPNEAIGWKSISGPKHSGRVTFSPIGEDTLVHVTINYAPPAGLAGLFVSPLEENLESHVNQALRDFKAAIEGGESGEKRGPSTAAWRAQREVPQRASLQTGTHGPVGDAEDTTEKLPGSVEYTRPPKPGYPTR
jgi:uncharacterized membrane protein